MFWSNISWCGWIISRIGDDGLVTMPKYVSNDFAVGCSILFSIILSRVLLLSNLLFNLVSNLIGSVVSVSIIFEKFFDWNIEFKLKEFR